jgi:RNA polymerase sigma-70 factor (sigma-E family)
VDEATVAQFTDFVRARHRRLTQTAFLLTGDRGRAEDVVQAALAKTFDAWHRLAVPEAAEAYTRTTMVRLLGRWGRRRWLGEIPTESIEAVATTGDPALGVDVRRALARLPWDQRAVLVLRYFDDLAERDVAALLGLSVGTVKSRTNRALAALRRDGLLDETEQRHG